MIAAMRGGAHVILTQQPKCLPSGMVVKNHGFVWVKGKVELAPTHCLRQARRFLTHEAVQEFY